MDNKPLDLKVVIKAAYKKMTAEPSNSMYLIDFITNQNKVILNRKQREREEYDYIPLSSGFLVLIGYFIKELNQFYKSPKDYKDKYSLFIDLGAGNGATKIISVFSSIFNYIGIEKYPILNYDKQVIKKADFLKIKPFKDIRKSYLSIIDKNNIIFYAYNPLRDPLAMYMALMFWVNKVLVSGDVLIYVKTSYFTEVQEKEFYSMFTPLNGPIYIYIKP